MNWNFGFRGFSTWPFIWNTQIEYFEMNCESLYRESDPNLAFIFLFRKLFISKFNITNFWKRHSTQFDVLFQMRLVSNYSTALMLLSPYAYGDILPEADIESRSKEKSNEKILLILSKDSPPWLVSMVKKSLF